MVIVGAGFGGIEAAKALRGVPVDVIVIDRQNHHCFQPLLYQVATAALSPADVAWPIRHMLARQKNATVLMEEVSAIDTAARNVQTPERRIGYDYLVLATGATHSYLGHDEWAAFAPGVKGIDDATQTRRRILLAFERAEVCDDEAERQRLLTFAIVGGGPTGVEMAGAIAEIARHALAPDFRRVDPRTARIVLLEAGPRILPALPEELSGYADDALRKMGVEVRTSSPVTNCSSEGIEFGGGFLRAGTIVWAAGVVASPAAEWTGAPRDRAGRVLVNPDLSMPGAPTVFIVGDAAAANWTPGRLVPGLAAAAKQMGRYVGTLISARIRGDPFTAEFHYRHQGDLATIGRRAAVVKLKHLELAGLLGWLFWSLAHIYFLIGVRSRFAVAFNWAWQYVTFQRGARLITGVDSKREAAASRRGIQPDMKGPNMQTLKTDTDILIAGAGPAGLALAAELRRRRANPLIVDRQPAGANTSRACVVHARTMEVLEPLGVTEDLVAHGVKVPIFRVRDRDRVLLTIDFSEIPSRYPFTLMIPQDRVERYLLGHLEAFGGSVVRPCELVRFEATESHVEAQLQREGETRTIEARWLIGCDGMHSRVREQSRVAFIGGAYEQDFVLADVHMDWPLSREEVTLFYSPDGLVVVAPLPDDRFRIVATVDDAPESPSVAFVQSILDIRGPTAHPGRIRDAVWSSRFHIHHRVAESPRLGRILLCGDAAHVHSPAGGQGMNTGIQDSVSLAEALIETLKDGDDARLDAWASARHRVARDVVAMTDRLTRIATMKSPTGKAMRNAAVAFAGHLPPVRAALAKTLAELDAR